MTFTQITLFFFGILAVIFIAMWVHAYLDVRQIRKHLEHLATQLPGEILQKNRFVYPAFQCQKDGRQFNLLFNEVKVGTQNILYLIYSLTASLPHALCFVKKGSFKPIADPVSFDQANGAVLPNMGAPFEARSLQPAWAEQVYHHEGVKTLIHELGSFLSLQLGPDALVIGKPFEGLSDADSKTVLSTVTTLMKLADAL